MKAVIFALVVSSILSAGSAYLIVRRGMTPCSLCQYQRAFAFVLMGVLGSGAFALRDSPHRLCLVALPIALAGVEVAAYQSHKGLFEGVYGTAAQQSLAGFLIVFATLVGGSVPELRRTRSGKVALAVGLVLGTGTALGVILV